MSRAAEARQALVVALAQAREAGLVVPCRGTDGPLWTSESAGDRARAAELCDPCPVLAECHTAAVAGREKWHVWAGTDRQSKQPRRTA